jgi:hypothetical protein
MSFKSERGILLLCTALFCFFVNVKKTVAQIPVGEISDRLISYGFENIRAYSSGNTLIVSYENNLFRDKATALSKILDILTGYGYDSLNVVTLVNDQPVLVTKTNTSFWAKHQTKQWSDVEIAREIKISYQTDAVWKSIRDIVPGNSHTNKIDLVVYPQIAIMNVLLDQLYEVQFNIAPALEVALWRGMQFTGQILFPIYNDPHYGDEGAQIRTGFVTLAQNFRLPGATFGCLVAGKFNAGRYGADLALIRYLFKGKLSLSANAGYTGEYQYLDGNWFRNDLKTITGFLKCGYFYKPDQLQLDFSARRYLNEDYGIRFDCIRYWKETAVGFYATTAKGRFNGGFHFAIPLCPKQYQKNRSFQLRSPSYFDWEYNAGTEFYYGQYYETRPNENRAEHFYNPDFITKKLLK